MNDGVIVALIGSRVMRLSQFARCCSMCIVCWGRALSIHTTILKRGQCAGTAGKCGHLLFLNACKVILDCFMPCEVLSEVALTQVRLQTEDLLGYFLVLSLNTLKLSFPLVEMQALSLELNRGN